MSIDVRILLAERITELQKERDHYLHVVNMCAVKIGELEKLQSTIEKASENEKKQNIQKNIKKNTLKSVLTDPDDTRRVNFFLEFMDKCGEETNFMKCREKMPKLESVLYRKNRLWHSWKEFLADYNMWIKREGPWTNVLVK